MTPSLAAPGQGLCRGLFASVDGLKSRPDLNGRVVKVGASKSDRWAIFDAIRGAHILVRPENLRAVVPPRELVDKALLADDTRSLIFEHLLPADLASAAGACASFRDQSCLTAARRGWERLPLTYERSAGPGRSRREGALTAATWGKSTSRCPSRRFRGHFRERGEASRSRLTAPARSSPRMAMRPTRSAGA